MNKVFLIAAACIALSGCGKSPEKKAADEAAMKEIKMQRLAREFVSKNLKDPDSAEFRNQSRLCGEVNSKNSFGGYVGFRRFIAANENMVVIEGNGRMDQSDFQQVWRQSC